MKMCLKAHLQSVKEISGGLRVGESLTENSLRGCFLDDGNLHRYMVFQNSKFTKMLKLKNTFQQICLFVRS